MLRSLQEVSPRPQLSHLCQRPHLYQLRHLHLQPLLFSLLPPVLQLLQALPVSLRSQPVLQLLWLL